jgi:cyclic beta-1,2-glucan synthetase
MDVLQTNYSVIRLGVIRPFYVIKALPSVNYISAVNLIALDVLLFTNKNYKYRHNIIEQFPSLTSVYVLQLPGSIYNKEELHLLILTEGIGFYINSTFLMAVLLILVAMLCLTMLMLYYRFSHVGRKVHFKVFARDGKSMRDPDEWERQMLELAESHSKVRLIGYNFVLNDFNQAAYKKLNKIRDSISAYSTDIISLIPAARWLFDNFQIMYREIKKVRTSGTSYSVLPILKVKEYRNFPRVYVVAKKIVALSGGHLSEENISTMLKAYQQRIPLTDKEIWVLPEMLGFCLLEEIINIVDEILHVIEVKFKAEQFVRRKLGKNRRPEDISGLLCNIDDSLRSDYSFHAHVIYLLKNMSYDEASIRQYLEYHFVSAEHSETERYTAHAKHSASAGHTRADKHSASAGHTRAAEHSASAGHNKAAKHAVSAGHNKVMMRSVPAGRQISSSDIFLEEGKIESFLDSNIRTLIISLRDINELDGEKFFENNSYLEQILSKDPDGVYPKMDLEARGIYREVIVKLSFRHRLQEERIAQECLMLAQEGWEGVHCPHHVGAYLIGKGYPVLKARVLGKPVPKEIKDKKNVKGIIYFLTLFLAAAALSTGILYIFRTYGGMQDIARQIITMLAAIPLLIGISLEVINFIFTSRIKVKKLPSMDYLKEIPEEARTFVVMPVIVSSKEQSLEYMERLQKHYLANRQPNLYFALLVDFEDSAASVQPKDKEIESALVSRMTMLNELYPSQYRRFSLFFRRRIWNKSENCYMGWERKRGKLEEFNKLLSGISRDETTFSSIYCDQELIPTFRYVITLDADTNLIYGNAAKLAGLIDHPLNKPVLDDNGSKVKEGYVIIQPSVRNHIVEKNGSAFAKIFGGESGLAHYGTLISDIYQDIFNKGIFIGKGIYDIRAFLKLLYNKVPENSILSHDLFESCYARTAFSSTAKIMDSFPRSVLSFTKREHRWLRGDWQLLPWLFIRKASGHSLCGLSKWKVIDNMRRSLVPLAKTLFVLLNLAWMPRIWYLWLPVVFFNDIFAMLIMLLSVILQKLIRPKLAIIYKSFKKELAAIFKRAFLEFTITPYRAYVASDAIIRTLYRVYISKRNLLRWNTAEAVDASIINTRKGYFLSMWSSFLPAFVLAAIIITGDLTRAGIIASAAAAVVWCLAFDIAYRISRPAGKLPLNKREQDNGLLIDTARRTWQYFIEFSTKKNNWLCPDNYQIAAIERTSDKTSPTNIGLQLLAILSARDLGFETISSTVEAVERLMETIGKLPKWKGHLYNWYNINTLEVLNPAYISTVDSGNFLGHLIALKNGLIELIDKPVVNGNILSELRNALSESNREIEYSTGRPSGFRLKDRYQRMSELLEDIADIWEGLSSWEPGPLKKNRHTGRLMKFIDSLAYEIGALRLKEESLSSCPSLRRAADRDNKYAAGMIGRITAISNKIDCIVENTDFSFLFNNKRMLFHIGYNVSSHTADEGCYDLMASESSLTSLLAIAMGEVPLKHWYKLGRPLTLVKGIPCFVSWSGTMFEFLMQNLVFKEYEGSVYAQTARAAVAQHMKYAREAGIPWGISESQYYRFDLNSNFQYRAFGVPKIRLQPVRKNALVVAPYATMLALDIATEECIKNLKWLKELGAYNEYGFYEAVDFSVPNPTTGTRYCIVKSFMTHHQGMILASINNCLNDGILRERFHREVMIKATEVLLEEKHQSHLISIAKQGYTITIGKPLFKKDIYNNRYISSPGMYPPVVNYMSNGRYSLMITSDGDGFSKFEDRMLYRWRPDIYANTGNYIYVRDVASGRYWSTTYHPSKVEPDDYQVIFGPYKAEFKRRDGDITSYMTVSLDSVQPFEIRKITFTNHGKEEKQLEVTSYLEVADDTWLAELSHPAFNKLFLESEYLEEEQIFLAKRRRRKEEDKPYLMHMICTEGKPCKRVECENDRKRFIGRNNTLEKPDSVVNGVAYFNNSGFCTDPIMSLRVRLCIKAGETACISYITGVCQNREEAISLARDIKTCARIDDYLEKFRLQKNLELRYLEITGNQLAAFQNLISPIFYTAGMYRGPAWRIKRNILNQSSLWKFGISGDNPILLLVVKSMESERSIRDALRAYEYLRINRISADLVILIDSGHSYLQEIDNMIYDMTSSLRIFESEGVKQSFFMLHTYEMTEAEADLLFTVARVVLSEETGIYYNSLKENQYELLEEY